MKKYLLGLIAVSLIGISGATVLVNHSTQKSNVCHVVYDSNGIPHTYCTGDGPTSGSGGTDKTGLMAAVSALTPIKCPIYKESYSSGGQFPSL